MSLRLLGHVALPPHAKKGGFDHAAVHRRTSLLYVAHTANDAVDVIDCREDRYLRSIAGLPGVAGALVSEERDLVFTSNRGENTVGIFSAVGGEGVSNIAVGVRPNGLAFDAGRGLLIAANVGDPADPRSFTVSIVDVERRAMIGAIAVPGRTRWTVYDPASGVFFVNIADPPLVAVIDAANPTRLGGAFEIPASGPHGLDLDRDGERLFCACDAKTLVTLDSRTGRVLASRALSGAPDVIFFHARRSRLYVAIGDPGVIDVFDTDRMERVEVVPTERGAHTIALDEDREKVYAFLPETHRAAVFVES
jgi:DNA-binding beta-propeller fold protein YncE